MTDLRTKVKSYAAGKLGQQDGNGECWTFCENALINAGAKTSWDLTPNKKNFGSANYVWGKKVDPSNAQPGDIVQLRNYKVKYAHLDGSTSMEALPHHSAIVTRNMNFIGFLEVMHQNVPDGNPNKKLVVVGHIALRNHSFEKDGAKFQRTVSGTIKTYQPIPG